MLKDISAGCSAVSAIEILECAWLTPPSPIRPCNNMVVTRHHIQTDVRVVAAARSSLRAGRSGDARRAAVGSSSSARYGLWLATLEARTRIAAAIACGCEVRA